MALDPDDAARYSAPLDRARAAAERRGYRYADPVDDDAYPRITAADLTDPPDAFPEGWGQPTERDEPLRARTGEA